MKINKIRLILKEIPFGIPIRKDAFKFYTEENLYSESSAKLKYKNNLGTIIKIKLLNYVRLIIYNFVDAHVNYISAAYEIFGSYGVNRKKIFITYNSPDTDRLLKAREELQKENILPTEHRIIHIGRLVKWKRVDLLIESVAELKIEFPDVELYIVGDGPERESLEKQVGTLNLSNQVYFIGSVYETKKLGEYLMGSSVYVLAGMGGLSINEAMSFSKPVICSVCDGTEKELVKDGFNGFIFREGDPRDLTQKIKILFQNPQLRNIMGENSFSVIKDRINIESVLYGYQQAFEYVYNK